MNTFDKVIFVCNGNTCRSPMAATVMANLKQDIISESRGMVVLFPEPYNPKAVAVAAKHNMIIPNNSATPITISMPPEKSAYCCAEYNKIANTIAEPGVFSVGASKIFAIS